MDLAVEKREKLGKSVSVLRRSGKIPAELYGHGITNVHIEVPAKEFTKIFKSAGENTVVNILLENERRPAMIHDLSRNPVTDEITSIDFYQVKLDEKITVKVPIEFIGESPAVKDKGGILVKTMHELEVQALPNDIPHKITIDIKNLIDIGQSVHVKDLGIPSKVKISVQPETVVASVKEKITEEQLAAQAAEAAAAVDTVKVETEEKKAERAAKKEVVEGQVAAKEGGEKPAKAPEKSNKP